MLEEANAYLDNRLFGNENWIGADDQKKESALAMAVDIISSQFGNKHQNYPKAVFEQALYLLDNRDNERFKLQLQNVKSMRIEDISESYGENDILISPFAKKLLQQKINKVVDIS